MRIPGPDGQLMTIEQSLKKDANIKDLTELINEINERVNEQLYSFEHLLQSHSRVHKLFKPFTQNTILLLNRLLEDFTNEGFTNMKPEDLKVLNKVLESDVLSKIVFLEHERFVERIKPILDFTEHHF